MELHTFYNDRHFWHLCKSSRVVVGYSNIFFFKHQTYKYQFLLPLSWNQLGGLYVQFPYDFCGPVGSEKSPGHQIRSEHLEKNIKHPNMEKSVQTIIFWCKKFQGVPRLLYLLTKPVKIHGQIASPHQIAICTAHSSVSGRICGLPAPFRQEEEQKEIYVIL